MARRHDDETDGNGRLPGLKRSLLDRRTFLTVAGASAFAGALGATGRASAVDLGAEGLSPGDNIDPYIADHWTDGSDVYVPPGTYQTNMEWWDTNVADATLRGDPAGVTLERIDDPPTWDGGDTMRPRLEFDGHVVVENFTLDFYLGQVKEKFDITGRSDSAHLELRNLNLPKGSLGCGDSQFGRARGDGQVSYKWCYIGPTANATFYQTSSASSTGSIRQVFDGCVMVNMKDCWRGGTRGYTIRDCLYWADEPSPNWSDNGGGDGLSSGCWSSDHNPFKFDQDYSFDGTIENLHLVFKSGCGGIEHVFDFQSDQPDTSGTAGPIYLYNDHGPTNFEGGGAADAWSFGPVHLSGQYSSASDYDVDSGSVDFVEDGDQPVLQLPPVWTPGGQGNPLVDSNADTGDSTPTTEEPTDGSIFEVVSTSDDAELDYQFEVDGTVEPTTTEDGVSAVGESNVQITDNGDGTMTVTGRTGNGYGDAFEINSHVTTFERTAGESDYQLRLDGDDVTGQFSDGGSDDGSSTTSMFEVVSTSSDAELGYTFTVDGTAERAEASQQNSSIGESNDTVTDNGDGTVTVEGWTGLGYGDAFTVTGPISGFERTEGESDFQLLLDGEDVTDQLASGGSSGDSGPKRIYIDGTAAPEEVNEYRVEVSGEIQRDEANSSLSDGGLAWDSLDDVVDGSTAVGVVGNGVDAYTFTGEVVDVTVKGNATSRVED